MENQLHKPLKVGRPKKLNRQSMIEQALNAYWMEGFKNVSLNEICRRAQVSKSSFYNEFGTEDNLQKVVLVSYIESTLIPFFSSLPENASLSCTLKQTAQMIANGFSPNHKGCLFTKACQCDLGSLTQKQLQHYKTLSISRYKRWIEQAKLHNEICTGIDTQLAATYLYAQFNNASALQAQGESPETIQSILEMAFSTLFFNNPSQV